jgi:hypothetical protein
MNTNQEKSPKSKEIQQKKIPDETKKEKEAETAAMVMIYSEMSSSSTQQEEISEEERMIRNKKLYEEAEMQRKKELARLAGEMPRLYQLKVQEKIREENKRREERERGKLMLSGRGPQSEKRSENSNDDESNKEEGNTQIASETNLLASTQQATSRIVPMNAEGQRVLLDMHPSYKGAPPRDLRTSDEIRGQDALEESEKRAGGKKAPQEESRYVLKEPTSTLRQKDPKQWARLFIRMNGKSHVIGEKGYEMIDHLLEEAHQVLAEEEYEGEESEGTNPPMSPQKEESKGKSGVWNNRSATSAPIEDFF